MMQRLGPKQPSHTRRTLTFVVMWHWKNVVLVCDVAAEDRCFVDVIVGHKKALIFTS